MRTFQVGDRISGRCATMGTQYTGTVAEVFEPVPFSGDCFPRYRLTDTGEHYGNGRPIEPIVETASPA